MYFPFFEKIAEWVKSQGNWVYWSWVLSVGIIGAIVVEVWVESGFNEVRILLGILILWWVVGALIIGRSSAKKQNKEQPK